MIGGLSHDQRKILRIVNFAAAGGNFGRLESLSNGLAIELGTFDDLPIKKAGSNDEITKNKTEKSNFSSGHNRCFLQELNFDF